MRCYSINGQSHDNEHWWQKVEIRLMRSLKRARSRARACRAKVGSSRERLLERVEKFLYDVYDIEMIPVNSEFLKGGRAEVVPAEGCLYYHERLYRDPAEKLMVILHELGHRSEERRV